ncbi:MAG: hypothetical protein O7C75_21545 [Verrucomicrobia bacterium]|nr:hypothetical protein [Verrucomicrobiota bacterium]
MERLILSMALSLVAIFGCSQPAKVDEAKLNDIFDLARGKKAPEEVRLDSEEIIENSRAYAKILSGHLGLAKDFDLSLLLGKVYYRWGFCDEALVFLKQSIKGKESNITLAATDYLLFSAALAGQIQIIEDLEKSTNSMLSKVTLSRLAQGDCEGLQLAIGDLTVSSKENRVTRSIQYIEFLCRWVAMNCEIDTEYFETELLMPTFEVVTGGSSWDNFLDELEQENLDVVQFVLIDDFLSICQSAVQFAEKCGNEEMKKKWFSCINDLKGVLYGQRGDTFDRLEGRIR